MSKEAIKSKEVARSKKNRVTESQRLDMVASFEVIATDKDGVVDKGLLDTMVSAYDRNHLVVGTRIDNWLAIKDSSPEAKTLCERIDADFDRLNELSLKNNLQFNKKGHDLTGTPVATHKVEIVIPKN